MSMNRREFHPKQNKIETERQKQTCLCNPQARNWGARLQKRVETQERRIKELSEELMKLSFFHHGEVKPVVMNKNSSRLKKIASWFRGDAMKWETEKKEWFWNDNGELVLRNQH